MIFLRLKRENQLGGDTRRLKYPRKTLFQKLELRRRRLPCSLVRSKRLYHSVHLNIKTLFVGFPTLEICSDSGLYFVRQYTQVPLA